MRLLGFVLLAPMAAACGTVPHSFAASDRSVLVDGTVADVIFRAERPGSGCVVLDQDPSSSLVRCEVERGDGQPFAERITMRVFERDGAAFVEPVKGEALIDRVVTTTITTIGRRPQTSIAYTAVPDPTNWVRANVSHNGELTALLKLMRGAHAPVPPENPIAL